jgi:hypothetical protein
MSPVPFAFTPKKNSKDPAQQKVIVEYLQGNPYGDAAEGIPRACGD